MEALILRLDAPLMSFGGVQVDRLGVSQDFPTLSQLTGLSANALGYDHRDFASLERLQERLRYAVRRDRTGERLVDYQTADLGQAHLRHGWTTDGRPEGREGGSASTGTTIRLRHYLADAVFTVALTLVPADEDPELRVVAAAFDRPERPLFIGRKPCLPASRLMVDLVQAPSLHAALAMAPLVATDRRDAGPTYRAWWPNDDTEPIGEGWALTVTDTRDWANRIHVGQRRMRTGHVICQESVDDDA